MMVSGAETSDFDVGEWSARHNKSNLTGTFSTLVDSIACAAIWAKIIFASSRGRKLIHIDHQTGAARD